MADADVTILYPDARSDSGRMESQSNKAVTIGIKGVVTCAAMRLQWRLSLAEIGQ